MPHRIEFAPGAAREFRKLPRGAQLRLKDRIDSLADNPRPHGCEKLKGRNDLYRIREGDYRVIYQINDRALMVLVVAVGDRREIYDRF